MSVTPQGATLYLNSGDVEPVSFCAHTGAPNAAGSNLRVSAPVACSFNAASEDSRNMSADVDILIPAGVSGVTHWSVYNAAGECLHITPLTTPRLALLEGDVISFKAEDTAIKINQIYVAP